MERPNVATTAMTEKARQLAEKLLELARRGEGGERENAEQALTRHLAKNGLTIAEFESDNSKVTLNVPRLEKDPQNRNRFYKQVVASVAGRDLSYFTCYHETNGRSWYEFSVTVAEKIEIEAKLEIYWKDYQEQAELFYSAYVQKNHLYARPEPGDEDNDQPLTPEEKARLYKMSQMMDGIDYKTIRKELKKSL